MATIIFPAFSALRATCSAAHTAAPAEMPVSSPSSRAMRRAVASASSLVTRTISSHSVRFEDRRDEADAQPLHHVRPLGVAGEHRRRIGLDRDAAEFRLARLEHVADAGERAAGADARYQNVGLTVGVAPDFFRRRAAMDLRIGRVLELLRHEVARGVRGDEFGRPAAPRRWRPRPPG